MAHTARHGLARRWSLWYQQYPVLLNPVWSQPAFPLDFDIASLDGATATLELMRPVLPANLLGTPAAVVPAGMADGLPVGIQVMGGKYTELRCLAVAEVIEQRLGPLRPVRVRASSLVKKLPRCAVRQSTPTSSPPQPLRHQSAALADLPLRPLPRPPPQIPLVP